MAKKPSGVDDFIKGIIIDTNKAYKSDDIKIASEADYISNISFLSSGNYAINWACTGNPLGAIAFGRITSLIGESASGKSLLADHFIKETQAIGGLAILFEVERARYEERLTSLGIDTSKLIVSGEKTIEKIFEKSIFLVKKIKAERPDLPVTVVIDSVSQASSEHELKEGFNKVDMARAKVIRAALRQITHLISDMNVCFVLINHQTVNIGANMYTPAHLKKTTPGGTAMTYFPSQIIEVNRGSRIKNESGDFLGLQIKVKIEKSRFYTPFTEAKVNILFDRGFDEFSGLFEIMLSSGVVKETSKGWYSFTDDNTKLRKDEIMSMIKADKNTYLEKMTCKDAGLVVIDSDNTIEIDDIEKETEE